MKKAFLFPLLLVALTLPSCGEASASSSEVSSAASSEESSASSFQDSSASSSAPSEEVNKLKELLAKQDLVPIYDKMFTSMFSQNYEVYSSTHGEEVESETQFYAYSGAGAFGCLYEVSEAGFAEAEALENSNFFDYLARGKGSYAMIQSASLVSYIQKTDEEGWAEKSQQTLAYAQEVEARFTESDVQVCNSLYTKDNLDGGYDADSRQYFSGIINKATLFDAITVRAFSDIFARTNLFDGQRSCEALDRIYFDTLGELAGKTDAELGEFIVNNDIRIEEKGDGVLVHFKVGDENLREVLDENGIIPGAFEGTLSYEKESGKFATYEYEISHVINETNEDTGSVHVASMEFKASGYSLNQKYDKDLYIDPNPTVYEDAEVFLNDVVEEVIPPSF